MKENKFWRLILRITKLEKINKFEKKFVVFDLLFTGGVYAKIIILGILFSVVNILFVITFLPIHYFVRRTVWKSLERQEREWFSLKLPSNTLNKKESIFDMFKTPEVEVVGEPAKGQWER